MTDLVKKNDIIIPLAALVGAPLCDKDQLHQHQLIKIQSNGYLKPVLVNKF